MASCKFLLCLLQQCKLEHKIKKLAVNILKQCQRILLDDAISLDIRANCAYIMIIVMDYLPKSEKTKFVSLK